MSSETNINTRVANDHDQSDDKIFYATLDKLNQLHAQKVSQMTRLHLENTAEIKHLQTENELLKLKLSFKLKQESIDRDIENFKPLQIHSIVKERSITLEAALLKHREHTETCDKLGNLIAERVELSHLGASKCNGDVTQLHTEIKESLSKVGHLVGHNSQTLEALLEVSWRVSNNLIYARTFEKLIQEEQVKIARLQAEITKMVEA